MNALKVLVIAALVSGAVLADTPVAPNPDISELVMPKKVLAATCQTSCYWIGQRQYCTTNCY